MLKHPELHPINIHTNFQRFGRQTDLLRLHIQLGHTQYGSHRSDRRSNRLAGRTRVKYGTEPYMQQVAEQKALFAELDAKKASKPRHHARGGIALTMLDKCRVFILTCLQLSMPRHTKTGLLSNRNKPYPFQFSAATFRQVFANSGYTSVSL